jgi:hypothetical protein
MKRLGHILLICCLGQIACAQNVNPYNLFNPVPKHLLRSMHTDRPDVTESPIPVDAGHFQLESDLFKTTRNGTSVENNYSLVNLKLGLSPRTDLQLVVESYVQAYTKDNKGHKINRSSGFGDLTLRLKHNLWGSDEGKTAFALMPYVNFPTSTGHKAIEGGIVLPFSLDLENGFGLGTQIQLYLLKSAQESGYHAGILQSFVIGKELGKALETFVESYYAYDFEVKKFELSVNSGLAYSLSANLKLDAGFNIGLTKNTDKVYFIGFSFRY